MIGGTYAVFYNNTRISDSIIQYTTLYKIMHHATHSSAVSNKIGNREVCTIFRHMVMILLRLFVMGNN